MHHDQMHAMARQLPEGGHVGIPAIEAVGAADLLLQKLLPTWQRL